LSVVIVIIGVWAAVAIPKMMATTNKAKAGEVPQILRSIGNMQAAYKTENNTYVNLDKSATTKTAMAVGNGWGEIGFEQVPASKTYLFSITDATKASATHEYTTFADKFTATTELVAGLGKAAQAATLTLNETDSRECSDKKLQLLVPNWK
jgi:type II secretory pathway pseudopilin PulG